MLLVESDSTKSLRQALDFTMSQPSKSALKKQLFRSAVADNLATREWQRPQSRLGTRTSFQSYDDATREEVATGGRCIVNFRSAVEPWKAIELPAIAIIDLLEVGGEDSGICDQVSAESQFSQMDQRCC